MPTPNTPDPDVFRLNNVRLSFPHLFKPHAMQEGQDEKYSATFILDNTEHAATMDAIEARIERLVLDEFKKPIRLTGELIRDGNEKSDMDGYGDGVSFISTSRKTRPPVVDRDLSPITEEDGKIYAGCYVNATIRLWVQNNSYGKRVNAELRAVQFVKDGESFGAGTVNVENEFSPLGENNNPDAPTSSRRSQRSAPAATKGKVTMEDF